MWGQTVSQLFDASLSSWLLLCPRGYHVSSHWALGDIITMLRKYSRVPKKFLPRQGAAFPESRASDLSAPPRPYCSQSTKDLLQTDKQKKISQRQLSPNKQTWVRLSRASGLSSSGCRPGCCLVIVCSFTREQLSQLGEPRELGGGRWCPGETGFL